MEVEWDHVKVVTSGSAWCMAGGSLQGARCASDTSVCSVGAGVDEIGGGECLWFWVDDVSRWM